MSFQPLPYAKRQKVTTESPNLCPPPARQPHLYEPTSTSSNNSRQQPQSHSHSNSAQDRPRASLHGNFVGYYTRRRQDLSTLDPRLALLPPSTLQDKKVLDVGCNSGLVTVEMAQRMGAARVVGVDIDEELVRLAKRTADLAWSRQAPLPHLNPSAPSSSLQRDAPPHASSSSSTPAPPPSTSLNYFPLALPRMFGYLPAPSAHLTSYHDLPEIETVGVTRRGKRKVMPVEVRTFPENLRFRTADWVNDEIDYDKRGYDVIVAFSITKWIHLHGLNAGLHLFFTRCYETLLPGGRLILEPQPFTTYAKSARLSDTLKGNYEQLKKSGAWKCEDGDFEKVLLEQIGFDRVEKLGETGEKGFRRSVEVYHKREGSWL